MENNKIVAFTNEVVQPIDRELEKELKDKKDKAISEIENSFKEVSLEELVAKFENADPETQSMVSKMLENDRKKLMLDNYVKQLQSEGMNARYVRRAMERKAKQLGLNKI